jgi:ATP-binding cassette, subfamily G (WHITE), member 2, PDR
MQFHGRKISCSNYVPSTLGGILPQFGNVKPDEQVCATTGAAPGADFVDGDAYLAVTYQYYQSHLWR